MSSNKNKNLPIGYPDIIAQQGKEIKTRNEKLRQKIYEQGPAFRIIIPDKEETQTELRMWKIDGGVVIIEFRNNKANLNYIRQYTNEYIEALTQTKAEG